VKVKWLNKALSLFTNTNDRFLVLEIFSAGVGHLPTGQAGLPTGQASVSGGENIPNRAASIKADFVNKEIKVLKVLSSPDAKKLLKKFGRLTKYKIIVSLDSHLGTTIHSSVVLVRENYKELIDEPELDNLISQAIWKFFDRHRSKVANKMNTSDLDIILSDVRVGGIKLDGHKVVNPVGFRAKTVEVQFSQTFLLRNLVDQLKTLLPAKQTVLITENGAALSNVLAKLGTEKDFLLANLFGGKTTLFSASGSQNSYLDRFNWGEDDLNRSVAEDLAITPEVSRSIIEGYVNGETSPLFKKRFEGLLAKELHNLARGLNSALKRLDAKTIYLQPFFNLPPLFTASFKNQFDRPVALQVLHLDLISNNLGFDVKFKNHRDSLYSFSFLAALMEWYLSPQEDKMSQLAKRRVRWLSPS